MATPTRRSLRLILTICTAAASCVAAVGCASSATNRIDGAEQRIEQQREVTTPKHEVERGIRIRIGPAATGASERTGQPLTNHHTVGRDSPGVHVLPAVYRLSPAAGDDGRTGSPGRDAGGSSMVEAALDAVRQAGLTVDAQDSVIEIEITERETRDAGSERVVGAAAATGASLRTSSSEAAVGFEAGAGRVNLPGVGSAQGGATAITSELAAGSTAFVLYAMGGVLIVVGVLLLAFVTPKPKTAIAALVGGGALLIGLGVVVERYPWVWLAAVLVFLAVAGYLGWQAFRSKRRGESLRAIVAGVEASPEARQVKDQIRAAAEKLGTRPTVIDREVDPVKPIVVRPAAAKEPS